MIGILLDTVSNNPYTYFLFENLNKLSEHHECYLFSHFVHAVPMKNKFPILQQIECMDHSGILISTTMVNTQIIAKNLTAKAKYFYPWHLEWYERDFNTNQLDQIFYNQEVQLIAKSDEYCKLFTKLFKKPKMTMYNWNSKDLELLCQ